MKKVWARFYIEYLNISTKCKIIMISFGNFHDTDKCVKLIVRCIGEAIAKKVTHGLCSYADAERQYNNLCEKMEQFKNLIYRM